MEVKHKKATKWKTELKSLLLSCVIYTNADGVKKLSQTSKREISAKVVKGLNLSTIFEKASSLTSDQVLNTSYGTAVKKSLVEYIVLGTIQVSFFGSFKDTNNKLGQKNYLQKCFEDIMCSAIYYKIQIRD